MKMTMDSSIAETGLGALKGVWNAGVAVFRGVPYAVPPVGQRRFAAPEPVTPWQGLHAAVSDGPIAPQPSSRLRAAMGDFERPQDEDCLTLTIWTPAPDGKARPVLVWLHGGAYMSGAGSLDWYDGATLVRDGDIVVVGVNYRLGACGFLAHPEIGPANGGLRDQQAALAWVAAHIGAFGGDPAAVTLMGQSAGGGSIAFLLTDPTARPLFRRAIVESAALNPPLAAAKAAARAERLGELLGITDAGRALAQRLRAVPIAALLEAQGKLVRELAGEDSLALPFGPVAAGDAPRSQHYLEAVASGAEGKEILIGCVREEMHAFYAADPAMTGLDAATLARRSAAITGDAQTIETYRRRRPDGNAMDWLADLATDYRFSLPSQRLAALIAGRGGAVWRYRFDWAPPQSKFRACHCIELPFVFGNFPAWREAAMLAGGDPVEMQSLSAAIKRSWINFVRDGTPQHAGVPSWPSLGEAQGAVLHFDRTIRLEGGSA